jgi:hypothetical protein
VSTLLHICAVSFTYYSAKYPLAMVSKALDVLGGKNLYAYDIGCSFWSTILSSSLGSRFQESGSRFCVNAFHGYAHNYCCQLKNHPNFIKGAGLKDLETLERVFSSSNHVVPLTRYASAYNRHVLIDMFFQNWDNDKYLNLGTMLHNNYVQALRIIQEDSIAFNEAKVSLGIQDGDLERWHNEQQAYFETIGQESEHDVHAVTYVELLQKLQDIRKVFSTLFGHSTDSLLFSSQYEKTTSAFLSSAADYDFNYATSTSKTRRIESNRRLLLEKKDEVLQELIEMEMKMGITQQWQPSDCEYPETMKYIGLHKYHLALNKLRRSVVQRLFELHKLNLAQTGLVHSTCSFYLY